MKFSQRVELVDKYNIWRTNCNKTLKEKGDIARIADVPLSVITFLDNKGYLSDRQRWIPVGERLPEEYGEYLITWTTSQSKRPFIGISEGEVTSEYDHEHNRFKFKWLLEDYVKNYPDVEVVAWMPLPELYKAESEE